MGGFYMRDSSRDNALLCLSKQLNRDINTAIKGKQGDLNPILIPIFSHYKLKAELLGFSFLQLKYTLGLINGQFKEHE